MNDFIQNNISWDKLAPEIRSEFVLNVEHAYLLQEKKELQLDVSLNFIIPHCDIGSIDSSIKENFGDISSVTWKFHYHDVIMEKKDIIKSYIPYMRDSMKDASAMLNAVDLNDYEQKDSDNENCTVVFSSINRQAANDLNDIAAPSMRHMLKHDFGYDVTFAFKFSEAEFEEKSRKKTENSVIELKRANQELDKAQKERGQRERASAADVRRSGNGGYSAAFGGTGGGYARKAKYEGPVEGSHIVGNKVSGSPVKIKDINADEKNIVVEGTVFRKDSRAIKNGKFISIFYITDQTNSICVKMFVTAQKQADFDEYISTGAYIRVIGDTEFDTFERMTVIMAKGIDLGEKKLRQDTSGRKRVELHAHTKMSQIDGIMEVKDLVNTAKRWGHKAVAVTDHGVVQSFPDAAGAAKGEIKIIYGVEGYLVNDIENPDGTLDYKTNPARHIILLAKNTAGLKNLYKLVSYSFLDYFYKRPRMPKSLIAAHREGLIIGSACEAGEVFRAMLEGKSEQELEEIASFYDYLEIQPRSNNRFMLEKGMVSSEEELLNFNRRIVALADRLGKPAVATSDAHYLEPEDYIYRDIIMAAHNFKDISGKPTLYLRTTDEMLEEFAYLGEETAMRVVIDEPERIADMIEVFKPIPDGKFPPKIEGSEERLRQRCYSRAAEIYGDPLPEIVSQRLEKELSSIIGNGYAVMYVAAEMLVQKSLKDGYLVGSRGSVGSSFAATMDGITEVNPLQPHYICQNPECKYSEFPEDPGVECGVDMPEKSCPRCGRPLKRDGFSIPFETFLGFNGDKEPDIDLNFAGEYQPVAHKYVEEIFGAKNVFKAGTIGTVQEKMAVEYVKRYCNDMEVSVNKYEAERLALGCVGVRKTTGQHPGGIVIVPEGHEIYEFCPVMHPADGSGDKSIITTHFDYHKIDTNLLKLDILGHDVPSMIRMLQDMTGVNPDDISFSDPVVNSIFTGISALNIKIGDYRQTHGTFGIPEFGTSFTRQMLDDTKPEKFSALVRIAGFSHGTDVWINNAQEFIKSGQATMDDAIATRDDIMNYLIAKDLPKGDAFKIMERVRKGRSVTEEQEALMREHGVPDWYIESCKRIKYMFPKAHAVAYVMMSYRIAHFKVYYPPEFYAVHFTMKVDAFNTDVIMKGIGSVLSKMDAIKMMGNEATNKEKAEYLVYEVVYEMFARGYDFLPARLGRSKGTRFTVENNSVRLPFRALAGMGETAANSLEREYSIRPFSSIEDMTDRTSVNSSNVETLRAHGVLDEMQESDQMSLFALV